MIELKRGRVAHAVPGRLRLKLDPAELSEPFGRELTATLQAVPGIQGLRTNPRTGSIVIHYDPATLDVAGLLELARTANLLAIDALADDPYAARRVPTSLTARRVKRTFHEVDIRLAELSQGRWDLRSVVPFAFGAMALRSFIRDFGEWGAAPWWVLAWYAFDSFWKLNQHDQPVPPPEPPLILTGAE